MTTTRVFNCHRKKIATHLSGLNGKNFTEVKILGKHIIHIASHCYEIANKSIPGGGWSTQEDIFSISLSILVYTCVPYSELNESQKCTCTRK